MKLYAISGLGADQRVFCNLTLDCACIPIEWIEPRPKERIEAYAMRLAEEINHAEPFGILGVSFGGLIAVEISKRLSPQIVILISSAETRNELRAIYRFVGRLNLVRLLPQRFFDPPRKLASWIFGAKNQRLLAEILNDTDLRFAKWAVNELLRWKNETRLTQQVFKISGTHDKLMPAPRGEGVRRIAGGAHFMVVDRAEEISKAINHVINQSGHR